MRETVQGRSGADGKPQHHRGSLKGTPLELVQIDHTMVDIMVVDDISRESIGRPWITMVFDVATRVVLGFLLSLAAPSATSVGLAMSMAGLPKERWLEDRRLKLRWIPYGIPKVLHLDNAAEFHSVVAKYMGYASNTARPASIWWTHRTLCAEHGEVHLQ